MKKIYRCIIFVVVLFVLFGCSNVGLIGNSEKSETFYFEQFSLYDQNSDNIGLYSCNDEGLTGSCIKVDMDSKKVEYSLVYDGKELFTYIGDIVEEEKEKDTVFYKVSFKELDGTFLYSCNDTKSIKTFLAANGYMGTVIYLLSDEEISNDNTKGATQLKIEELDGVVTIRKTNMIKFEESDIYKTVEENIYSYLGEYSPNLIYNSNENTLLIHLILPAEGYKDEMYAYKSELIDNWKEICDAFDTNCSVYYDAIKTSGYGSTKVMISIVTPEDDTDILYSSVNGVKTFDFTDNISDKNSSYNSQSNYFTNKYGTATTKCHHDGCNNYIASSGDTWDCEYHAGTCLNCGKYIDCDAMYCMDCLSNSTKNNNNSNTKGKCTYVDYYGNVCGKPVNNYDSLCDQHYKELYDTYTSMTECHICGEPATQRVGSYWYCTKHAKLVDGYTK